jgi:CRP-like cAMP-binding protein
VSTKTKQNQLLATLPGMAVSRFVPDLKCVDMPLRPVHCGSRGVEKSVYVATSAMVSLLYLMANDDAAQIAVIGVAKHRYVRHRTYLVTIQVHSVHLRASIRWRPTSLGSGTTLELHRMTDLKPGANRVLAGLPSKSYQRLRAQLEPVILTFGQILYEPGETIRQVYFPVDCLISLLTAVDKRRTLEVGMVGNEGMTGIPLVLGVDVSGVRALVQGGGNALGMSSTRFHIALDKDRLLQQALFRYTHALMTQISQTAACNRFHAAEARLARWLLMTRERVGSDNFPLTHEFLAHMLGLRREGVTEAASALKRRKLISYSRGKIQILDVRGLKASTCSCYQIVNTAYQHAAVAA